jgi:hypothetical protein
MSEDNFLGRERKIILAVLECRQLYMDKLVISCFLF